MVSTDIDHLAEAKRFLGPHTTFDPYHGEIPALLGTSAERAIIHGLIAIAERLPAPKPHSTHYR